MSSMFWGIALGAAGAFLLDPQQGRRRRTELRDEWERRRHDGRSGLAAALFLYGLARGGIGGLGAIVLGSAVLARALGNRPVDELVEEAREKLSS